MDFVGLIFCTTTIYKLFGRIKHSASQSFSQIFNICNFDAFFSKKKSQCVRFLLGFKEIKKKSTGQSC